MLECVTLCCVIAGHHPLQVDTFILDMPRPVVDTRSEDVAHASHVIPFNLPVAKKLLSAPLHGAAPIGNFTKQDVAMLQADASDYIASLDSRLKSLFADDNAALAKRLRETGHIPVTLAYFQVQQNMLELSGDLTTNREKTMLANLASLVSQ